MDVDDILGGSRDPRVPAWRPEIQVYKHFPAETVRAAEDAYLSFLDDPWPFIALYWANPGLPERQPYADLELLAICSQLDVPAGAGPLVLQAAEQLYGEDLAYGLECDRARSNYQGLYESIYNTLLSWGVPLAPLALVLPEFATRNAGGFFSWVREYIQKPGAVLTTAEADQVLWQARAYGITAGPPETHPNYPQYGMHVNVGKNGYHVRVPEDYILPWERPLGPRQ